eukprot:TRINITY_DN1202_c0_g1_i3.p1 TRINITY_DN1202_c0_g1~~TRINITY_DN1202_c0_g1_i3.p1  ORF type:complete len:280 (+),score=26.39 TRINITY_DN1202_c0_g1_i3:65-904(+)
MFGILPGGRGSLLAAASARYNPYPAAASTAAGWVELMDQSTGRGYFINTITGQSQWERPGNPTTAGSSSTGQHMDAGQVAAWAQQWTQQRALGGMGRGLSILGGKGSNRCRFYGPGTTNDCRRGQSCPFQHDDSPGPDSFCRFFGPGTSNDCKRGDKCPFVHDETGSQRAAASMQSLMQLQAPPRPDVSKIRCRYWGPGTSNDCRRGDQCPFKHSDEPGTSEQPRCRFYPGDCKRGTSCPFQHIDGAAPPKPRCRFWGPGTPHDCRRGSACPFVHESLQ